MTLRFSTCQRSTYSFRYSHSRTDRRARIRGERNGADRREIGRNKKDIESSKDAAIPRDAMPRHVHYEDTRHLNATLLHLSRLIHRISTMNRLNASFWNSLNITDEDIDYVNKFMDNLSISCNDNCEQQIDCYCNGTVRDLAIEYKNYHGYVALMVCLFGTLANMLNIVVLTRKDMVATPINRILTGLATADMLVMLEYIPFAIYMYIVLPKRQIFPYGWAVFVLFHMHFTQLLHTISIAITLTLAVWRYIAIRWVVEFRIHDGWCALLETATNFELRSSVSTGQCVNRRSGYFVPFGVTEFNAVPMRDSINLVFASRITDVCNFTFLCPPLS